MSLLSNSALLNKVYCPREAFPIASVVVIAVDTLLATVVLGVLFVINETAPQPTSVWVPLLLAIQVAAMLGGLDGGAAAIGGDDGAGNVAGLR